MTKEQMKERLYSLYQLDWMMSHGNSIKEIIQGMFTSNIDHENYIYNDENGVFADIEGMYNDWEQDVGFNGSIWAGFGEFCEIELNDASYVKKLLNHVSSEEATDIQTAYAKYQRKRMDKHDALGKER